MHRICLVTAIALLTLAPPASAQTMVTSSGQRQTVECQGNAVQVMGNGNTLTLRGECTSVEISGSTNIVHIEAVDAIDVSGTTNQVTWERTVSDRKSPRVTTTGTGNVVSQAGAAKSMGATTSGGTPAKTAPRSVPATGTEPLRPAPKTEAGAGASGGGHPQALSKGWAIEGNTLRLPTDGNRTSADCAGRDVSVLGNNNTITLRGECPNVMVPGNSNKVTIEAVRRISADGNQNVITWTRAMAGAEKPQIANPGNGNTVTQATRR